MVSVVDLPAIEQVRRALRIEPHALRRLRPALLKHGRSDAEALEELPAEVRGVFTERVQLHALELHSRCDSAQDGATKLLFRTTAGMLIEAVILRIATGRTTLCLSSQGRLRGRVRLLRDGENGHRPQPDARRDPRPTRASPADRRRRGPHDPQSRVHGNGRAVHNEESIYQSLTALTAPELFHHPPSRILISTVGLPDAMVRAARRFPEVHFALSLHTARQEVREQLIPLAVRYPLAFLHRSVAELNRLQSANTDVMIEYLMLAGVNDSADDARALVDWLAGLRVHVNLIPYNPIDDAPHLAASDRATCEAFGAILKAAGLKTTIRYSLGADVAAACGQLVRRENRQTVLAGGERA